MPELPDIVVYIESLDTRITGQVLERVRLANPFILRTALPPIAAAQGKRVTGIRRIGKRVVIALQDELFLVVHLMVAGRLRWLAPGAKALGRIALATFDFHNGTLDLTEAGTKRRASLHLIQGEAQLAAFDAGGIEVLDADSDSFAQRLRRFGVRPRRPAAADS